MVNLETGKRPLTDIIEGVAELIIEKGEVTSRKTNRETRYEMGVMCDSDSYDMWAVIYDGFRYIITYRDGVLSAIDRYVLDEVGDKDEE